MTQIRESNWFWGKKKSSKFLDFLSWLDSYIKRERESGGERDIERERVGVKGIQRERE